PPFMTLARTLSGPVEVGGYSLKVGTDVAVTCSAAMKDEHKVPSPSLFVPSRWLSGAKPDAACGYIAFGAGPRACPAMELALTCIEEVIATLLR
ncbi:cytochrome P450, partial [Vibrio cholerae]|nr:cytochrome P450 [Vibrio cholerae]